MLGLKRGEVLLLPHDERWEPEAEATVLKLREILGDLALDIQHVGSTSVKSIMAKPIIDIAVAVRDFDSLLALEQRLKAEGFYYRPSMGDIDSCQLLFAKGSLYDGTGELQTHFIHVVKADSMEWSNYIRFRNQLNSDPAVAKEYESLKLNILNKIDKKQGRNEYTAMKANFIVAVLEEINNTNQSKNEGESI